MSEVYVVILLRDKRYIEEVVFTLQILNGNDVVAHLRPQGVGPLATIAYLGIVAALTGDPKLDQPTQIYLRIKQRRAEEYGIKTSVWQHEAGEHVTTQQLVEEVRRVSRSTEYDGVIVQLPLPPHVDTQTVLEALNPAIDVDDLTGESPFVSPMVQAVAAIEEHYNLSFETGGKRIAVVGSGRLVGQPIRDWLVSRGLDPLIVDRSTPNPENVLKSADVIISGTGHTYLIDEHNTRAGQTIIDCTGRDVNPVILSKKDYLKAATPAIKGGVGPLTVHFLMMNTLKSAGF